MKTENKITEADFLVINKPLPEEDRRKLSAIIAQAKKTVSKKSRQHQ